VNCVRRRNDLRSVQPGSGKKFQDVLQLLSFWKLAWTWSIDDSMHDQQFPEEQPLRQLNDSRRREEINVNVFSIFSDLENMGLDTLIRQIGQVLTEI